MASHLANIFGTEQDRVNCSFYYKIGACRHGDRCSRKHIRPPFSQTILLPNVYQNPAKTPEGVNWSAEQLQRDFDTFYEDFYCELTKFGHLLEMHVCDNIGDHLQGNVYARYEWEAEAQAAVDALNDRWYAAKPLHCELSPVTDFREACCRQNEMGECTRGGHCNFMHLRHPTPGLVRSLTHSQRLERRKQQANKAGGGAHANGISGAAVGVGGAAGGGGAALGWIPPSLAEGTAGGWVPPPRTEDEPEDAGGGESWRPSY